MSGIVGTSLTPQQKKSANAALRAFNGDLAATLAAIEALAATPKKRLKKRDSISDEVIIRATNVVKSYKVGKTQVQAVNDVSIEVKKGEFVALVGTSGSGKSTLLHLIGGLDKPSSGTIEVDGKQLDALSDTQLSKFRNKTTGFVFQFFYLQPFLNLQQNIEVPAMFNREKRTTRGARSTELAGLVGLEERTKHLPRELSGGQMQRAAIARAMQNNPSIVLADEPTGNLDRNNAIAIFELFQKICFEQGTTIVVVTHDAELAALADRTINLRDGAVV